MSNYAIYPSLKDRAVFVTGGGSGIGASIVEHFCAQGSKVAFVDIAREASEALVKTIAGKGMPAPLFIECNITDIPALQKAIAEAKQSWGRSACSLTMRPMTSVTPSTRSRRNIGMSAMP